MNYDFKRIAIVNRGEPAMRLIHAVQELNHEHGSDLRTIALATEPDRRALFVREADEVFDLGPATFVDPKDGGTKSRYLDYALLEEALLRIRAEAVWVGWGFVAEHAAFADLCKSLGIVFIGPDGETMRRLGDKITSKKLAEEAGVPVAPWSGGALANLDEAKEHAARLGYPLMLKATAGGGGRGIRKVTTDAELAAAFDSARSEALKSFGDADVFLESMVVGAHHVEVQIVADREGHTWALGVRDCTLQRRNQKILEESPSPVLTPEEDAELRAGAARLCQLAGYKNAGTVEFLFEPEERRFAFMEVNARLQVEHPVTEMVTGVDIVKLQIHVARGGLLEGDPPASIGHAVEVRLNAEDPESGFAPAPGHVELFHPPRGPGLRLDTGVEKGDEIAPQFDSMIAKLIARGKDREEALGRLRRGLAQTAIVIRGGTSNKAFLEVLLDHPDVRSSTIDVAWLDRLMARGEHVPMEGAEVAVLAAAIEVYEEESGRARQQFLAAAARGRPTTAGGCGHGVELKCHGHSYQLHVCRLGPRHYLITPVDGEEIDVWIEQLGPYSRRLTLGRSSYRIFSVVQGGVHLVEVDGIPHRVSEDQGGIVRSPSPAMVVALHVKVGDEVAVGDRLVVLEAMKMETQITSDVAGRVKKVLTTANVQVGAGAPLLEIEPSGDGDTTSALGRLDLGRVAELSRENPHGRHLSHDDDKGGERCHTEDLRRLVMGYDVEPAAVQKVLAEHGMLCRQVGVQDPARLAREDLALDIFVDICSLARRQPTGEEIELGARRSREDHLFTYLQNLGAEGRGLPEVFLQNLRQTLSHYGVASLERTPELEESLYRLYKSYQRMSDAVGPILNVLERRLEFADDLVPNTGPPFRELLERMTIETRSRFPAVHDLAREVHYRFFDQPFLEKIRHKVYAEAETHIEALEKDPGGSSRRKHIDALVGCPQPLKSLLSGRWVTAVEPLRHAVLEVMIRRFYRDRRLSDFEIRHASGRSFATARYSWQGVSYFLIATHTVWDELGDATKACAELLADVPKKLERVCDFYIWRPGERTAADVTSKDLLSILGPLCSKFLPERVVVAVSGPAGRRGLGEVEHFTYRHDAGGVYREDLRYRHLHPMLGKRLEIDRLLTHFNYERLPSAEDVYLFRGFAKENPKDERLIAFAEVRDVTPVRDDAGKLLKLPEFERIFLECLAGIRRFQARRPPTRRLHWNRIHLYTWPTTRVRPSELRALAHRLAPAAEGLGLEKVKIRAQLPRRTGRMREIVFDIMSPGARGTVVAHRRAAVGPLLPLDEYSRKVVRLRQRGLWYPYELVKLLAPEGSGTELPPGEFVEWDLAEDGERLEPVARPPGQNRANVVAGVIKSFTARHPEGMTRVALLSDPSHGMGSLAEPECRRVMAALELAEEMRVPLEWFAVSAGAKISMESGTENMDWIARVLRRLIHFTQAGGEVNLVVNGVNVGAQPYWNAEATMLMHTRGILIMTPEGAMVLTGKQALDFSGGVSAEDNQGIGGYERIMGPNGQAQYFARDTAEACLILMRYYDHSYVAPGERFPRRAPTEDPRDRDVCLYPHGGDFEKVGGVFSLSENPGRKKPFDIRQVMTAVVDADYQPLERWYGMQDAEVAVVWDAHLGGCPVCLLGLESHPLPRYGFVPADGPDQWTSGTLFPLSSKKVARAINSASKSRPLVVLANLSGFDGSPESMRKWQLEYGAEIGRAVVNFEGPIVFCVISRYHGGAFVVFSNALHDNMEVAAIEGSYASVIGGAPAAAVVFAREVTERTQADPRIRELDERIHAAEGPAKARLRGERTDLWASVHAEKLGEMSEEFDRVHSIERAREVGSVHHIIAPSKLRTYLIEAVERGMEHELDRNPVGAR